MDDAKSIQHVLDLLRCDPLAWEIDEFYAIHPEGIEIWIANDEYGLKIVTGEYTAGVIRRGCVSEESTVCGPNHGLWFFSRWVGRQTWRYEITDAVRSAQKIQQTGGGYRPTGNTAFDQYRDEEMEKLRNKMRDLSAEGHAFAVFLKEQKNKQDAEDFNTYRGRTQ